MYYITDYSSYKAFDVTNLKWIDKDDLVIYSSLTALQKMMMDAGFNFPHSAIIVEKDRLFMPIVQDDGNCCICYYTEEEGETLTGSNIPNGSHTLSCQTFLDSISDAMGNDLDDLSIPYLQAERLFKIMN